MTSDEERLKRRQRLRRNHLAKALEDRRYRQRRIDKNFKKKRVKEIEDSFDLDSD